MKKQLLLAVFAFSTIMSCNNESAVVNTMESMKTPEVEAFDKAFKSLGDPKNQPTEEERRNKSVELSNLRKEIIIPASKTLIISTGISEAEMNIKTGGDKNKIIAWALDISSKQKEDIYKTMKTGN